MRLRATLARADTIRTRTSMPMPGLSWRSGNACSPRKPPLNALYLELAIQWKMLAEENEAARRDGQRPVTPCEHP